MSTLLREPPSRFRLTSPWIGELSATVLLALPMIGTQLGQMAISATDTIMIGWLGTDALAGSSAAGSLYYLTLVSGIGLLSVTGSFVAQARGRRDARGVRRSVRQGLWVALSVALPAMYLLSEAEAVLTWVGQLPEVARLGGAYLKVMLWSIPSTYGFIVLRNFLAALSRPRAALVITLVGVSSNALLNYALMFGKLGLPAWGLLGAAASSVINTAGMCLALLLFVLIDRRLRRYHILARFWRPDWQRYRQFLRVGLPVSAFLMAEIGMFSTTTTMMGWIGPEALAAHAIALNLASITFMVPFGLGLAGQVRIGLALGAGDRAAQVRAGGTAFALGVLIGLAAALAFLLAPEALVGIFLDPGESASRAASELAVALLAIAAFCQLSDGVQVIASSLLIGVHDTRRPMLLGLLSYWAVGAPAAYLLAFPLGFGARGVWFGIAAALSTIALLLVLRLRRHLKTVPRALP